MTDPLVLLPGFMTDARIWGAQIEMLSPRVHLVLPTLSSGGTVEDMALAVLPVLPERFALAGHSLGAAVAMEILRRAPDRVSRIALMSTGCLAESPTAAADREARMTRARAGRLDAALEEDFPDSTFAPGEMRGAVAGFIREAAAGFGAETYLRQSRAMQRRPDQQRTLRQARLPALVIGGKHDTIVPPRRQQFVAELMPNGTFHLAEAGHFPSVEAPEDVTAALVAWLDREAEKLLLR